MRHFVRPFGATSRQRCLHNVTHFGPTQNLTNLRRIIQLEEHMTNPDARWGWYINGEIVAGQITAIGHVTTREQAKAELAKHWPRWVKLNGLPENHRPLYG